MWDGMLEAHSCKKCGRPLGGHGRPAELYAGTYNGLCTKCTMAESYVVRERADGAKFWSHPPHCPSWRRSREQYWGYDDCPDCDGRGAIMVSRPYAQGGPYRTACPTCSKRSYGG